MIDPVLAYNNTTYSTAIVFRYRRAASPMCAGKRSCCLVSEVKGEPSPPTQRSTPTLLASCRSRYGSVQNVAGLPVHFTEQQQPSGLNQNSPCHHRPCGLAIKMSCSRHSSKFCARDNHALREELNP